MNIVDESGKFKDLLMAIVSKDLEQVRKIIECSHSYFGYWGSCTPEKEFALQFAKDIYADSIHKHLCEAWGIPSDDSWKSTAINVMDLICRLHLDGN